jgi:hypothetical protein
MTQSVRTLCTPRDWPEEFHLENGQYDCYCHVCGQRFTGHKRRATCKACTPAAEVIADRQKRFHDHLDDCDRCRNSLFDLCSIGAAILSGNTGNQERT